MKKWLQRIKNAWKVLTGQIPPEIASLSDKQVRDITGIVRGTHHAKAYAKRTVKKSLQVQNETLQAVGE